MNLIRSHTDCFLLRKGSGGARDRCGMGKSFLRRIATEALKHQSEVKPKPTINMPCVSMALRFEGAVEKQLNHWRMTFMF